MKRSSSRILTTHVGSLVRPPDLMKVLRAKESGRPYAEGELAARSKSSVAEVVRKQVEAGIDVPSDGEYGKPNFAGYVNERLSGFERGERDPDESPILNWGRDRKAFLEFYREYEETTEVARADSVVCSGPIAYSSSHVIMSGTIQPHLTLRLPCQ